MSGLKSYIKKILIHIVENQGICRTLHNVDIFIDIDICSICPLLHHKTCDLLNRNKELYNNKEIRLLKKAEKALHALIDMEIDDILRGDNDN